MAAVATASVGAAPHCPAGHFSPYSDVRKALSSTAPPMERGRPMEIDALVGAVQELGRLVKKPTPTIDGVLALVRRLAMERGCYG
ncbi:MULTISPECIES: ketopantoate reductase C-terminal domain-containing protein [unclassified Mesorhizobium]|uniref:ketopantoate reductase C-terminal domain-containing protein n=1 Tax=Mesorhizobium sp. B2-2-2 TaxID=2589964 RepID=UPI0021E27547|nr:MULTISPECIES: ketopantoate reductase C-terminal domain-containing protein [unclassified Mesorhizobium]